MPAKVKEVNNNNIEAKPKVTVTISEVSHSALEFLNSKQAKKIRRIIFRSFFLTFAVVFFTFYLLDTLAFDIDFIDRMKGNTKWYSRLFWTGAYIIVVLTVLYVIAFVLHLFAGGSKRRKTILSMVSSFTSYVGYIVLIVLILNVWGVSTAALLAGTAVIGLIIGLGAQSLISDILSGVFLVCENNIQVGDMITYDGFRGEVVHIGIRTTRTKSPAGDVNVINNSELKNFINMSKHRSLAFSYVRISYSEDLEKVEKIIKDALPAIARKLTVITEGPTYMGVHEYTDLGLVLRISAKCPEENRPQLERDLNREFKLLFDKHKIKFAVHQVEVRTCSAEPCLPKREVKK